MSQIYFIVCRHFSIQIINIEYQVGSNIATARELKIVL